ncbi:hypothetical protein COY43_00260 [Candidatus Berkelbacteria bacterium CG_4_10_14_0_8_um_filter_35_9_33_8]|uniref:Iron transporter n=1 Tax=Candidatus Berkelbacteria bacterium CG_4_10_14_0_2_um_filter_35_9_33_12 TaxID=1974499 RepID=A0A2M7W3B6_9BACT|nr:MAG: hypothetical protein COX10_02340 [Candidatus Berkelbacteria bacterium CG23_combo_of_CG06-09_8_20_14_all_33_15]PIS08249.1 MAG: hypothetical protein COT76_02450 [Candidatus Berkelbacteria bacterium CG10_big_fil_rev_8_21_14_0_10_33_10]PIZ28475.1 MAG: hypothetical protein COY43_00260 [Candidatus Berkelbacteria bacterium CG_4_10_14_0_8_um_filter_35_9_33_8]PJA19969.1 MAG: hypothetical protein COX60_03200 [Candidatus Berkelbacteria bacterium CG_4_10_14_0_2_um_filter_35_9_33_12]
MRVSKFSNIGEKSVLADVILGGQDGLVNVLSVILGVSAASNNIKIIIAGGLATTFAESISVGAVALTSKLAERDYYNSELTREKRAIKKVPQKEIGKIRSLFEDKGLEGEVLENVVKTITSNNKLWLDTLMEEGLKLEEVKSSEIYFGSLIVLISALIGSFVPLVPYLIIGLEAFWWSLGLSAITLLLIGIYKAKVTIGNPAKSGVQMVIIGIGVALVGYLIGRIFGA